MSKKTFKSCISNFSSWTLSHYMLAALCLSIKIILSCSYYFLFVTNAKAISITSDLSQQDFIDKNDFSLPKYNKLSTIINKVITKKLYNNPIWLSLIHSSNNSPKFISDEVRQKFYLQYQYSSFNNHLKNILAINIAQGGKTKLHNLDNNFAFRELVATLMLFSNFIEKNDNSLQDSNTSICNFPARFLWLSQQMLVKRLNIQQLFQSCQNLYKFINNNQVTRVNLVYAQQDLSNIISVFGHLYLELVNNNNPNQAITYVTPFNKKALPIMAYEALISRGTGILELAKAEDIKYHYLLYERRNIYSYPLKLNSSQMQMLLFHFWELKDINTGYHYIKHNCATIIFDLLKVIKPEINNKINKIVNTPIDYIKRLTEVGIITGKYNLILAKTTQKPSEKIISSLGAPHFERGGTKLFLAYGQQELEIKEDNTYVLDKLHIKFTPGGNYLLDKSEQFFGSYALKMAELTVSLNKIKNQEGEMQVRLEKFNYISVKKLSANPIERSISYQFEVATSQNYDSDMSLQIGTHLDIGLGSTYPLSYKLGFSISSIDLFAMLGVRYLHIHDKINNHLQFKQRLETNQAIYYPQFGLVAELGWGKLFIQWRDYYSSYSYRQQELTALQSIYLGDINLHLKMQNIQTEIASANQFMVGFSYAY